MNTFILHENGEKEKRKNLWILHKKFINFLYNKPKYTLIYGACNMEDEKKEERKEEKQDEAGKETSYEFLKETIKAKPVDKKRIAMSLGRLAAAGAFFGLAAAIVFGVTAPKLAGKVQKYHNDKKVKFASQEEERVENQTDQQQEQTTEADAQEEQTPVVQDMTPQQYQDLYQEIFAAADTAQKSMVTVIGSQNNEDWFETPYENQISGVIAAENGQDFFVLTEYRIVENVDRIQVVLWDGTMIDARFQKADRNTGFAVLKIPKSELSVSCKENIAVAPLGDSYGLSQGEPVLAIGSPMGYSDSVGYGIITSVSNKVSKVDAEYDLVTTDITGSSTGSGVILNLDGEVIGIIAQSFAREDTKNLITALPISQSKEMIQMLSDNQAITYMGITGESITSEISEKKGIPVGVFVESVEVDSPAMQVGIQNGDVIVEINGEKVETVKGYEQQLKSCKPGENIKVKAMRQGTEGYVEVSFSVTLKER